jgi:hypothetical protein
MAMQKNRASRVRFDMGYRARIMAIDGTWFRDCHLEDVSQTGAKISVTGTVEGLNLGEFFLVLSHTGTAHRRCRMIWIKGEEMGLRFETSKSLGGRGSRAPRSFEYNEE